MQRVSDVSLLVVFLLFCFAMSDKFGSRSLSTLTVMLMAVTQSKLADRL